VHGLEEGGYAGGGGLRLEECSEAVGAAGAEFGVGDGGGEDGEGESEGVVDLRGVGRAVGDQVWGCSRVGDGERVGGF